MSRPSSCKLAAFAALRPKAPTDVINEAAAKRVLGVLAFGLPSGLGTPLAGRMCVEAAVAYSMGYDHSDRPKCVLEAIASFKISLNDQKWSSDQARGKGLRGVAIAQLGSNTLKSIDFETEIARAFLRRLYPVAARLSAISTQSSKRQLASVEGGIQSALDVLNGNDNALTAFELLDDNVGELARKALGLRGKNAKWLFIADVAVEALVRMKTKGSKYLYLLNKPVAKKRKRA